MARAEVYENKFTSPPGRPCVRFWVHPQIMIGGNLNGPEDWAHLRDKYGIRAVVNLDHRSEAWMGMPALSECPVEDNGQGFSRHHVRQAVSFAWLWTGIGPIYVHCHIGVSRSPAFAYGMLRWIYGMSEDAALTAINMGEGEFGASWETVPKHVTYMKSVDRALSHD